MIAETLLMPGLVQLIVILVVLGIMWYFLRPYVAEPFQTILTVIVILAVCLWLLRVGGIV